MFWTGYPLEEDIRTHIGNVQQIISPIQYAGLDAEDGNAAPFGSKG